MKKKSDIHRFTARGESVLSIAALEQRLKDAEAENDRLRRRLKAKAERDKVASSPENPVSPTLH